MVALPTKKGTAPTLRLPPTDMVMPEVSSVPAGLMASTNIGPLPEGAPAGTVVVRVAAPAASRPLKPVRV